MPRDVFKNRIDMPGNFNISLQIKSVIY